MKGREIKMVLEREVKGWKRYLEKEREGNDKVRKVWGGEKGRQGKGKAGLIIKGKTWKVNAGKLESKCRKIMRWEGKGKERNGKKRKGKE